MATWTSKYGTKINIPDGLTPKQINEIKTQANNKYGVKAQELANQYGKALTGTTTKTGASTKEQVINPVQDINLGVNKDGTINAPVAASTIAGAESADVAKTINAQNANITDALGNTQTVTVDPVTGKATVVQGAGATAGAANKFIQGALGATNPGAVDLSGAPKIMTANDLKGMWDQSQQALYGTLTQNLDRNKGRDLEAQKQELANRGFVYNPGDQNSGYGKAIGAIDERYKGYQDAALQQSIAGATNQMSANAGVNSDAYSKFVDTAFRQANNPLAQASTAAGILGATSGNMPGYQGTQSDISSQLIQLDALVQQGAITKEQANLERQKIAKMGAGGGGGGGSSGFAIGGELV